MKKVLLGILCAAIVLSTAACGQSNGGSSSATSNGESSAPSSQGESTEPESKETKLSFGKISSLTGNEIKISVAKDPSATAEGESSGTEGGAAAGGPVDATAMVPAGEGTPGDEPKMELEYTGESKDYVIPAGVKIIGITGGEEQLSSLKKGSVLLLVEEVKTGAITEIRILE